MKPSDQNCQDNLASTREALEDHEPAGKRRFDTKPHHAATVSEAARQLGIAQLQAGRTHDDNQESPGGLTMQQMLRGEVRIPKDYISTCHYHWEHVILDECQHVKCIRTRQPQSIAQLSRNFMIGLTGTRMWNRIEDIYRYLSLLAGGLKEDKEDDVPSLPRPKDVACGNIRELYTAWSKIQVLPRDFDSVPYALLNPAMLVRLAPGGQISPALGHAIFPFLFRTSPMMRSMGDRIGGSQWRTDCHWR